MSNNLYNSNYKTKFCVFLGRKPNVEILHKYIEVALINNIITEYHMFNFTRSQSDHIFINEEFKRLSQKYNNQNNKIFIYNNEYKEIKIKQQPDWSPFYKEVSKWSDEPNSIIVKCDDDILFIDIYALKEALDDRWNDKQSFLIHSNCINNGVCAYYLKDKFSKLTPELLIYPQDGLLGPLFVKPELAYAMHVNFITNTRENNGNTSYFHIDNQYIASRISINFIMLRSEDLKYLKDVSTNDEYELSSLIPEQLLRLNKINGKIITSHLSYQLQDKYILQTNSIRYLYSLLYDIYSNNVTSSSSNIKNPITITPKLILKETILNWINKNHIYIKHELTHQYIYYDYNTFELKLSSTIKTPFEYNNNKITLGIYYFSKNNIRGNFKCEQTLIKNMRNPDETLIEIENMKIKFIKHNEYLSINTNLNQLITIQQITNPKSNQENNNNNWIIEYPFNDPNYDAIIPFTRELRITNGIKKIFYKNTNTGEEYCNIHSSWSLPSSLYILE